MQSVQARKIQITTVEDIEAAGLEGQLIEDVDVVNAPRGDNHHSGIIAPQRQQGVQLDRGLGAPELGPGKERQAQIDGYTPDSARIRKNPPCQTARSGFTERMIRPGFLDIKSRQNLIELARDGLAAHRLARRANALVLLDDGMSCEAIKKVLLLGDDTIRTWYRSGSAWDRWG